MSAALPSIHSAYCFNIIKLDRIIIIQPYSPQADQNKNETTKLPQRSPSAPILDMDDGSVNAAPVPPPIHPKKTDYRFRLYFFVGRMLPGWLPNWGI